MPLDLIRHTPKRYVPVLWGVLHTSDSAVEHLMGMQFYVYLIKFTYDWSFCPSNNLPLYYVLHWDISFM